ncbi:MAG: PilZ domain-containing protein [Candidatus Omnitrophica bacterium]|jgi:hypothetical protein|nr:PilZ domain-containing protein [Candidatus Omnitrophota bacterium]
MRRNTYSGPERRKFIRLDYIAPLGCKICSEQTMNKLLQGYTADVSEAGLLCNIREQVKINDILWLAFDRGALSICSDIEKRALIYQNGIIGKVARIDQKEDSSFNVGVNFITREEKNLSNIYPKIHFTKDLPLSTLPDDEADEEEQDNTNATEQPDDNQDENTSQAEEENN